MNDSDQCEVKHNHTAMLDILENMDMRKNRTNPNASDARFVCISRRVRNLSMFVEGHFADRVDRLVNLKYLADVSHLPFGTVCCFCTWTINEHAILFIFSQTSVHTCYISINIAATQNTELRGFNFRGSIQASWTLVAIAAFSVRLHVSLHRKPTVLVSCARIA